MFRIMIAIIALCLTFPLSCVWAQQSQVFLDFDDDNDPWTIRTDSPTCEAVAKVVLEVGATVPAGQRFNFWLGHGCCRSEGEVYLGTSGLIDFYAYSGFFPEGMGAPICQWGSYNPLPCPGAQYFFNCRLASDLDLEPGERYFMGEGVFEVVSDPIPCRLKRAVSYGAKIGGEQVGSGTLVFTCLPSSNTR